MWQKKEFLFEKAVNLRRSGYSYREICRELGIGKGTAYAWTRNEPLGTEALKRLQSRRDDVTKRWIAGSKLRRESRDRLLKEYVQTELERIKLDKNLCRLLCAFLYWGEGAKITGGVIRFMNSDPAMIRSFLFLFRRGFDADESKFYAFLHLHQYHDSEKQVKFWSEVTGFLPEKIKIHLKPNSGKIIRENYPGCISIAYGNIVLFNQLLFYYELFSDIHLGA